MYFQIFLHPSSSYVKLWQLNHAPGEVNGERGAGSTAVISFQNARTSHFQQRYSKSVFKNIISKTVYLEI